MHRDGRYGSCRSLSPPFCERDDYRWLGVRCQVGVVSEVEVNYSFTIVGYRYLPRSMFAGQHIESARYRDTAIPLPWKMAATTQLPHRRHLTWYAQFYSECRRFFLPL